MSQTSSSTAILQRAKSSVPVAYWRLCSLATATLLGYYPAFLAGRIRREAGAGRLELAALWTQRWSRGCLEILRIPVECEGPVPKGAHLLAPNHTSYMDILALSSVYPSLFAPKADVAGWPVVGHLTRMTEHVFITRRRTRQLQTTLREITERLSAGTSVCVFLEGTTTGGRELLPFKPAFLQPAIDAGTAVLPVGIRWTCDDPAVDPAEDIAYWKDHHFPSHIKRLAGLSGIRAKVRFGEPVPTEGKQRGELALRVREDVADLLAGM